MEQKQDKLVKEILENTNIIPKPDVEDIENYVATCLKSPAHYDEDEIVEKGTTAFTLKQVSTTDCWIKYDCNSIVELY